MRKIFILVTFLIISSAFAVPQIEYRNRHFVVNEDGYVKLSFAFDSPTHSIGDYGFVNIGGLYFTEATFENSAKFNAGDIFGVWGSTLLTDPSHIFGAYTMYLVASSQFPQISQYEEMNSRPINITSTDTSLTGSFEVYDYYYDSEHNSMMREKLTATFTLDWTPEGGLPIPSGQPLPGIIPALLLGGAVYVARRRKKMAA